MKRLLLMPLFSAFVLMLSCSKNTIDSQPRSKVDILMSQIKDDPQFKRSFDLVNSSIKIISQNIANMTPADTSVLQDKSLSYAQKSAKLNFTGDDAMHANYLESEKLLSGLRAKYPILDQLTDEESKLFYKKTTAYFLNPPKAK